MNDVHQKLGKPCMNGNRKDDAIDGGDGDVMIG
jgi:hypothetical protein